MPTPEPRQKLLDVFASVIEVHRPDPQRTLSTSIKDLEDGRAQVVALLAGVVRPNTDELDPRAAGRQRFPALQGVAGLFAEGLGQHPDIVAEILAGPEDLTGAVTIDQSIGRLVYAGELLDRGGETGEVLCATAAQKLCLGTLAEARARITDPAVTPGARSDVSVAFAEPFRLEEDHQQRRQAAQAKADEAAQPYLQSLERARTDSTLLDAVDAYLTSLHGAEKP